MATVVKPPALREGAIVSAVSPASPAESDRLARGVAELERLGLRVRKASCELGREGYFAGSAEERLAELEAAFADPESTGIFCSRGGYGSTYLLDQLDASRLARPKVVLGYSDFTSVQVFLWQKFGWVSFYGPMVAAGFDAGPDGYDRRSFLQAVGEDQPWSVELAGETLVNGETEGILLGGCLTLLETTLGTPWEFDAGASILVLEDRGVQPYQLDRMLMHLMQAGKLRGVRGLILGEFPDCQPPPGSNVNVREVVLRVLEPLEIPLVWKAPLGHAARPMLTLPLGVRARLRAAREGQLEILEPAVTR